MTRIISDVPSDGEVVASAAKFSALLFTAILIDLCLGAFLYKVWNERLWRIEQHAQVVETKRLADAFSFYLEERGR